MALPLHERAMETDSTDLVRMTLLEGGASRALVDALIPSRPLEEGEQYRFHFDMTKCIGCRSCEVACNEQNGNPADIKWRRVGELEGGVWPETQRTYLSMGCNHCVSADCVKGCPVDAYTKDPLTGIVLHSADACIGCQYCVWNCPYSVPQFNPERGVVGKCDMCRGRLLEGREPACVNACPENAIQIEIVNKLEWSENYAAAESPGMPPAGTTISTTRITLPENNVAWLERVDNGHVALEHAHPSLVVMTTAMQATFGTLTALVVAHGLDAIHVTLLVLLTAFALNVSVFHLGRPAYAWRAMKMWRRSWLSREVLCFSLFMLSIVVSAAASWASALGVVWAGPVVQSAAVAGVVFGLMGTLASAFIYLVKARPAWNVVHTPLDFLLSSALIGSVLPAFLQQPADLLGDALGRFGVHLQHAALSAHPLFVVVVAALWVVNLIARVLRLRGSANFESRASYNLLRGEALWWKVALAVAAAVVTPLFFAAPLPFAALLTSITAVAMGRYLFFVSVVPLNMGLTFVGGKQAAHAGAAA
ncbi:Fe-S-cluster-containing hydrogenase subunit [Terriglobus roseus DSM 18391]|uniref:Fe-S-cluster-containing hydrogenase subunit n=1 Tax=Terriglobus roseus (strain DSM 18391 / NRRL B-41598 / KBS 63) TaxID=926566 RepID=I3ZE54_TERRK|nr:DmsC/YnfH family molybdoenzyme membrane anchor subunit [Terriglobus roseus]AFL87522.1 Fe-S-cluster-containing hydrogenase subunit [Terriglobus roseus DSM 18391]